VTDSFRRVGRLVLARPELADGLLFVLMAVSLAAEFIAFRQAFQQGLSAFQLKLWFALTVPVVVAMLFRRLAPVAIFGLIAAIQLTLIIVLSSDWLPNTFEWSLYVVTFTIASRRNPRLAAAAVAIASLTLLPLKGPVRCPCMIQEFTFLTFAAIAGFSLQTGRRLIEELRFQAGVLERTRGERVKLVLTEQRSKVARDLHDVVAHGVTVMVVQAGAARTIAGTDPHQAEEMLERIEHVADEAADELRALVTSLDQEEGTETEPAPQRLEDLPALVDHERATGLGVDLSMDGTPRPVDPAMDVSLFRIAQEALTNARKHAPGAPVRVTVRYGPRMVEIEVVNGPGPDAALPMVAGFGRGLIGIRERAALFGGEAVAGPTPDAGFRVLARLPFALVPA